MIPCQANIYANSIRSNKVSASTAKFCTSVSTKNLNVTEHITSDSIVTNDLTVFDNLLGHDGQPLTLFDVDASTSSADLATSGPIPFTFGSKLRFWSETLQINVSEGSALINIEGNVGLTGPTGPHGVKGSQGGAAPTGPTGQQGIQGVTGSSGPQGVTGSVGQQGIQGVTGSPGIQGVTGSPGIQGVTGSPGIQGVTGSPGIQGVTGSPGIQGVTGSPGIQGVTGLQGVIGSTGPQGIQGTSGPQGIQGVIGPTGPQGPIGPINIGSMTLWNGPTPDYTIVAGRCVQSPNLVTCTFTVTINTAGARSDWWGNASVINLIIPTFTPPGLLAGVFNTYGTGHYFSNPVGGVSYEGGCRCSLLAVSPPRVQMRRYRYDNASAPPLPQGQITLSGSVTYTY
jgi:hypothetical protein